MNKIIAIILGVLISVTPVLAWNVDIGATVSDASIGVFANALGDGYMMGTTAGIAGSGEIDVEGQSSRRYPDHGILETSVGGSGAEGIFYATQNLGVVGCCEDCDCDGYTYMASQGVAVDGEGEIDLETNVNAYWSGKNMQKLNAEGSGDFVVGMSSTQVVGTEVNSHAMGASGSNVWFKSFGIQKMDLEDCDNSGFMFTVMGYADEPCEGDFCPR